MLYSMTGYGKAEVRENERNITVEIRSVNHRYLECNIRMPRDLYAFESEFRSVIEEYACRGKVDVFINYKDERDTASVLHVNMALAGQYLECGRKLTEAFGVEDDLKVSRLLSMPEVLHVEEETPDEEERRNDVLPVLRMAAERFSETRRAEGNRLRENLLGKLDELEQIAEKITEHEPEMMAAYTAKLREKIKDLLDEGRLEESRISAEVVMFADKICTDEETVRLRSHVAQMREALNGEGSIGRKLDFITQEMNREANTILSKSGDMATSDWGVTLKTVIEKIREQIQNIE
ncbi:MAG: YicC family protein [Eubacterium sp.]|nr:YicC family protein [Eubacterium sp.]